MAESVFKEEIYAIIGACFNVYKGIFGACRPRVLRDRICFSEDIVLIAEGPEMTYRGQILRQRYKPGFICFQKIIVELKAVSALADAHRA